ncbi:MAG: hypothetical protein EA409_02765 [Saprospirales bacterium]|nr:MAG: hypothetical protein EA409_02765 [Saprospirales bacterium]
MGFLLIPVFHFAQIPDLIYEQTIKFRDFEAEEFQHFTPLPTGGNLLLIDDYQAIYQLGTVEVGMLDLRSGETIQRLDMHELFRWVSEAVHAERGEEFCIPGREGLSGRIKPKYYPIHFDRIMEYPKNGAFATLTRTVIWDQDREPEEQSDLFYGLLILSSELEILHFFPLRGYEKLRHRPSMHFGGHFHEDIAFTKVQAHLHESKYEFVKYQKTQDNVYEMIDTMTHWPTVDKSHQMSGTIFNFVVANNNFHIPLLDKIHIIENWKDKGVLRYLPLEPGQYIHSLESLSSSQWKIAMVVNTDLIDEHTRVHQTGELSQINPTYTRIIPLKNYRFRDRLFNSMTTKNDRVALLFYSRKDRTFELEVFEFKGK